MEPDQVTSPAMRAPCHSSRQAARREDSPRGCWCGASAWQPGAPTREVRDLQATLATTPGQFNRRQSALLEHATRTPGARYFMSSHNTSLETGRHDLLALVERPSSPALGWAGPSLSVPYRIWLRSCDASQMVVRHASASAVDVQGGRLGVWSR